jgi:hypothetical protein
VFLKLSGMAAEFGFPAGSRSVVVATRSSTLRREMTKHLPCRKAIAAMTAGVTAVAMGMSFTGGAGGAGRQPGRHGRDCHSAEFDADPHQDVAAR